MKLAVVSNEAFNSGDEFPAMPFLLKGLYPPSKVCERTRQVRGWVSASELTHHVVCDELKMAHVDINLVRAEHGAHFSQNGLSRCLDAICTEDRVDVI